MHSPSSLSNLFSSPSLMSPAPPTSTPAHMSLYAQIKSVLNRPTALFERVYEVDRHLSQAMLATASITSTSPLSPSMASSPSSSAMMSSTKDLESVFLLLMGDMFGSHCSLAAYPNQAKMGNGWNLALINRQKQVRDFNVIYQFLAPAGSFMRLVQHLSQDAHIQHPYPVAKLPPAAAAAAAAARPSTPLFLDSSGGGGGVQYIMLTPFEFYFHHLISLLNVTSPEWYQNSNLIVEPGSLYTELFEIYLQHFLPIGGGHFKYQAESTVYDAGHGKNVASATASPTSPTTKRTSLFRADLSQTLGSVNNQNTSLSRHTRDSLLSSPPASHNNQHHAHRAGSPLSVEAWRSCVFVDIVAKFWLSPPSSSALDRSPLPSPSSSSSLPSTDVLRLMRMIVKHLHFFFNSFHPAHAEQRESLRRDLFRPFLESLYSYLYMLFDHWPLDASFRLVIETWLSYIQPWRYEGDGTAALNWRAWEPFVVDNADFYQVLFRKAIARFMRLDLTSNQNAYMVARVFKVYGQEEGLVGVIRSAEQHFNLANRSPMRSRQGLEEDWESNSIFGRQSKAELSELLTKVCEAKLLLKEQTQCLNSEAARHKSAQSRLTAFLQYVLKQDSLSDASKSELDELERTTNHLEQTELKLTSIFGLAEPNLASLLAATPRSPLFRRRNGHVDEIDSSAGGDGTCSVLPTPMSPEMRWQIINRNLRASPKFLGNPDELPLRSDEFHLLARLLHKLTGRVNQRWAAQLERAYEERSLTGALARQILQPPSFYRLMGKHGESEDVRLPARLILRWWASHITVFYSLLFGFLAWLLGSGFCNKTAFLLLTGFFVKMVYDNWTMAIPDNGAARRNARDERLRERVNEDKDTSF